MAARDTTSAIVLFDGTCGFCNGVVKWFIARDKSARLRFASLQSPTGQRMLAEHRLPLDFDKSLVLIDSSGKAATFSTGTFNILRHLPAPWNLIGSVGLIVPRFLRDAAYRLIASQRYRISERFERNCKLPTQAERARYIDHVFA